MSETGTVAAGTPNPTSWTWYLPQPRSPGVRVAPRPPMLDPMAQPVLSPQPVPYPLPPSLRPYRPPSPSSDGDYAPPRTGNTTPRFSPYPRPPKKGEKEGKKAIGPKLAAQILDGLTESIDAVEAVWKALPAKHRHGKANMLNDLADNFDKIDWAKAAFNLAYNAGEDAIAGRIAGAMNKAFRKAGLSGVGSASGMYGRPAAGAVKWVVSF